ncbi:uncharacterized protein [Oscarella lobularis]|uniref:uncharacterized protein isoform X2 n=1 Tax=Oscarella lobularis TaxID=121494 RepID=UPI003313ED3D
MSNDLTSACASGDVKTVDALLAKGADPNRKSSEGFAPLCLAAFWGHSDVCETLLERGADVNGTNTGTLWTAAHCAAFQGHGKALMIIMNHSPNLTLKDHEGRTAADFGSALDSVWPFFGAKGCKRTTKADLIAKKIVKKIASTPSSHAATESHDPQAYFSRPGSAYVLETQPLRQRDLAAGAHGDVLGAIEENSSLTNKGESKAKPSFSLWKS